MAVQIFDGTDWSDPVLTRIADVGGLQAALDAPPANIITTVDTGKTAIGAFANPAGDYSTALGVKATSAGDYSTALGREATVDAAHSGSTAIGGTNVGASTATTRAQQIMLGGANHETNIPGKLILHSPNGSEWQITVDNSGALTATAYTP